MRLRLVAFLAASLAVTVLSGCGQTRENRPDEYTDTRFLGPKGNMLGRDDDTIFTFGKDDSKKAGAGQGTGVAVNAYLWRGALDTLSFMPLVSADPFGGVIITEWYTPVGTSGERFKATAYILGRELRADAVRVSLFHQVQQGGQWVDAPVSTGTAAELEDKVLIRARELRANGG